MFHLVLGPASVTARLLVNVHHLRMGGAYSSYVAGTGVGNSAGSGAVSSSAGGAQFLYLLVREVAQSCNTLTCVTVRTNYALVFVCLLWEQTIIPKNWMQANPQALHSWNRVL